MTKLDLKLALTEGYKGPLVFSIILLLYLGIRTALEYTDPVAVNALESTWLLIATSMLTFLVLLTLCWWLLRQSVLVLGLPEIMDLTYDFQDLKLWQQLGFYLVLFTLLLLAALVCLVAIC